jgi:very-short-patch-repair endonuclease
MANERARQLRQRRTDAEIAVWQRLRRKQLDNARFRQQVAIGPYIVDFLCLSHRLIVEIDGGQHATNVMADATRTAWLESQDFHVMRFWNSDVGENLDGVVETILDWLRRNPSTPTPSRPRRGGGGIK